MNNGFKNVYDKFESFIINNTDELSINEYKSLLSTHNNIKSRINNSIIIQLITALEKKIIDPNKLLDLIIDNINSDEHLLILSLLLRNGADVNKYIPLNDVNVHLLSYVTIIYQNNLSMKNTILLLLLLSGANPKLEVFKNFGLTIIDWLKQNKIDSILLHDKDFLLNNIDTKLNNKIVTLLNIHHLIKNIDNVNITEVIRDHSHQIFEHLILNLTQLNINGKLIHLCIKYYNEKAFNICLNYGIQLRYYQINSLILQMKFGTSKLIKQIIYNMLNTYINHGGHIDKYQLDLLNQDHAIHKNINENYILDNLRTSGYNESDILYIKKSYIEHGSTYEKDARLERPKKGNDFIDLSNINGINIPPDMFEDIIFNKKINSNPSIVLSHVFLDKLYIQRIFLKRLGYSVNKSKSKVNESYINEDKFNRLEKAFTILIKLNLDIDINKLSLINMEEILASIEGENISLLNMLTIEHYKRTFAITCHEQAIINLNKVLSYFK